MAVTISALGRRHLVVPQPSEFNKLKHAKVNVDSYIVKLKSGASKEAAIQALSGLMFDFDDNE